MTDAMIFSSQSFVAAVALASVHLIAGKLRFLDITPRSMWLSFAGGVSVAYVFMHILPDLAEAQTQFTMANSGWLARIERHVWMLSLAGLSFFYGLERLVRQSRRSEVKKSRKQSEGRGIFWIHISSFAAYNLLFGYLLPRRETSAADLALFVAAIGLHFVVNDFGLQADHRGSYDRIARWLLGLAILAGWAIGCTFDIHPLGVAALFAFLAGGIVLNVLKEELPEERQSRFWAFAAGAAVYCAVRLVGGA
jgi:zinc transporter ZupT